MSVITCHMKTRECYWNIYHGFCVSTLHYKIVCKTMSGYSWLFVTLPTKLLCIPIGVTEDSISVIYHGDTTLYTAYHFGAYCLWFRDRRLSPDVNSVRLHK